MSHDTYKTKSALINYPQQAAFGRTLPKSKIYEHSGAKTKLKELFVLQVEQIIWQYKLAPETINLPARTEVPEIQVFCIQLKTPEVHYDILRCVDGAVQFPVVYELRYGQGEQARTKVVAAHKRPSESDSRLWVLSSYFATDWLPASTPRAPMPIALDLAKLYEALLHRLLPMNARAQESIGDLVARVELTAAKRREVERTASKLAKERQFNRKIEINGTLRQLRSELEQLSR